MTKKKMEDENKQKTKSRGHMKGLFSVAIYQTYSKKIHYEFIRGE